MNVNADMFVSDFLLLNWKTRPYKEAHKMRTAIISKYFHLISVAYGLSSISTEFRLCMPRSINIVQLH